MGNKNKTTNISTCQHFILEYSNLNKYAADFILSGVFLSSITLPLGTNVTYFEITDHCIVNNSYIRLTLYIRLNKKVKFNPIYFTFHLNNTNYLPTKKTIKASFNGIIQRTRNLLKYDNTQHTCIRLSLEFDGHFLFHLHKSMIKDQLIWLFHNIKSTYHWKASPKYVSIHVENKNIILSFEYKSNVNHTSPPTKLITTQIGKLRVVEYDSKANREDCINNALLNNGFITYGFSEY